MTLSSITPTKDYLIRYNANGGSVSPANKNLYCIFKEWNTQPDGRGTSYAPGSKYSVNADVTLYAQWTDPVAGALATPMRSGYSFVGWYSSSTGGEWIKEKTVVTKDMTLYARWVDIYNLGDETYSFPNYKDSDSKGHCFGMSMASAGYHTGLLDISAIGGNANSSLYGFSNTAIVRRPICYLQRMQGRNQREKATVAGGTHYLYYYYDIDLDWNQVIDYVSDHTYDNTGLLQIGFRKKNEGGHAVNFLRYEVVNGQERIYAYDNNFPSQETYFYKDSSGYIRQAPVQSFSGAIDCIALRDVRIFYRSLNDFDSSRVLYMPKDSASVVGYNYSYMEGTISGEEYVMYEIPSDQNSVIIIPNNDYADFIYMDTEYSFGIITEATKGELTFATMNEGSVVGEANFRIFEDKPELGTPDFVLPSAIKVISEYSFEGIPATVVYIPDACTSIGAYAFKNSLVERIRIPAGCSIADTAFEDCGEISIYGTAGSPAETFCNTHDNCTFIEE